MFDLLIENARICDGTGAPSTMGSLAVKDGRIAAIGPLKGEAAFEKIDALGAVLAPGFIDPHTHYDAQLAWDPTVSCSPLHGVTTVTIGNCGVGVAPVRPESRDIVMQDLVGVEGIPFDVMKAGIDWQWESYGEYLDVLDRSALSINVAGLVALTPLRHYVLGEDSFERAAAPAEVERMAAIFSEALDAGAFGFSTTVSLSHSGARGRPIACRNAGQAELSALARTLRSAGKGVIELAVESSGWNLINDEEVALLKLLAAESRRPMTFLAVLAVPGQPGFHDKTFAKLEALGELKSLVMPQTSPRPIVSRCDLRTATLFSMYRSWAPALGQDIDRQIEVYRSPAFRDDFLSELRARNRAYQISRMVVLDVADPALARHVGRSVGEIAEEQGQRPIDVFLDIGIRDRLATQFQAAIANFDQDGLERLITDDRVLVGLSDGGAHNDVLCDAGYATAMLDIWVHQRKALTLEKAVSKLTGVPARFLGLHDRGRLAPGMRADLALFDPDTVCAKPPHFVSDLPGGARRLIASAAGVKATIVAGRKVCLDGQYTGERPGRVLRCGKH